MNELQVKVLNVTPAVVNFNFDEMLAYAKQLNSKYANLVFDEESVKEGKATVAEIRKTQKSINDFKIKTKKELTEQVTLFEGQCKEIISEFDSSIEFIQGQLDKYEETRKANRIIELNSFVEEALQVVPLEEKWLKQFSIKDEWLNISMTNPKVKKAIMEEIQRLSVEQKSYHDKREIVVVKCELYSMKFGLEIPLIPENFYHLLDNFDGVEIDRRIYEIAEKTKANEVATIERIQKQAEEKARIEATQQVAEIVEQVQAFIPVENETQEKTFSVTLKIEATKQQMDSLKAYMDASGIKYGRVNG